jgi:hypothetical protein
MAKVTIIIINQNGGDDKRILQIDFLTKESLPMSVSWHVTKVSPMLSVIKKARITVQFFVF